MYFDLHESDLISSSQFPFTPLDQENGEEAPHDLSSDLLCTEPNNQPMLTLNATREVTELPSKAFPIVVQADGTKNGLIEFELDDDLWFSSQMDIVPEAFKNEMEPVNVPYTPEVRKQMTVGFSTAAGKRVKAPSMSAMSRAKSLFDSVTKDDALIEIVIPPPIESSNITERAEMNEASREAVDNVGNPFDIVDTKEKLGANLSMGFSSAKGKRLKSPTKESIHKAKQLFANINVASETKEQTNIQKVVNNPSPPAVPQDIKVAPQTPNPFLLPKAEPNKKVGSWSTPLARSLFSGKSVNKTKADLNTPTAKKGRITQSQRLFEMSCEDPRYTLKDYFEPNHLACNDTLSSLTSKTAVSYRTDKLSPELMQRRLIAFGANPKLVTDKWIKNHYRWIVWKIASLVRSFISYPPTMLCPNEVFRQLCYRYEREVNLCQRSCLKQISERDDVASKYMILCIADINGDSLELTDGWYSLNTEIDSDIKELILRKRLRRGQKIGISGARLLSQEAVDILEADQVKLGITFNSIGPAKWHATLGYQKVFTFIVPLGNVKATGGFVPCIDVFVVRVYPVCYVEKRKDETHRVYPEKVFQQVAELEGVPDTSTVTRHLKVKIIGESMDSTACVTFWNVDNRTIEGLKEGKRYQFFNLKPSNNAKEKSMNLSSLKGTFFQIMNGNLSPEQLQATATRSLTDLIGLQPQEYDFVAHLITLSKGYHLTRLPSLPLPQ